MTRDPREAATRDAKSRESTDSRRVFESLRDLPPDLLPVDMDVRWVTETVLGAYQDANITQRLNRDGFVPLTTDDVPALKIKTLPGRESTDTLIRNGGGQVLMGRARELDVLEKQDQLREAAASENDAVRGRQDIVDGRNFRDLPSKERTTVRREQRARSQQFPE